MNDQQRKKLGATGWLLKGAIEAKKAEAKKAHHNPNKRGDYHTANDYATGQVGGRNDPVRFDYSINNMSDLDEITRRQNVLKNLNKNKR